MQCQKAKRKKKESCHNKYVNLNVCEMQREIGQFALSKLTDISDRTTIGACPLTDIKKRK